MPHGDTPEALHRLAADKLARIFGASRGAALLDAVLREVGISHVASPEDLARVGAALERRGGFEATAGAMLSVDASLRAVAPRQQR